MYTQLNTLPIPLPYHEFLNVGVIEMPALGVTSLWERPLKNFLAHKPDKYKEHIDKAFKGQCLNVVKFYVGSLYDCLVSCAMTATFKGTGHLSHVFTHSDHRGKGIASQVLSFLLEDFRKSGGKGLILGTEYGSVAYRLYTRFGFVDCPTKPGVMYRLWEDFDWITEDEALQ